MQEILFFPCEIQVFIENKQLFFTNNGKNNEILTINQHSANDIINSMEKIYSADISQKNKQKDISIFFPLYYYFIYQEHQYFTIKFRDTLTGISEIEIAGTSLEMVKEKIRKQSIPQIDKDYFLDFYADTIAVLTINTFNRSNIDLYQSFLKNSFQQIAEKNCKYLFIDIKNNGGGSSNNVNLLLDYLFSDDYRFFGGVSEKKRSKAYIKKYEDKEDRKRNKKLQIIVDYGFFERTENVDNPFTGTLFLLQSNLTASASLDMSSAIKSSRRGIVLGEPTGEPACEYSQALVFEMPNSKLSFQCATGYFLMPSGSSDEKWIQPDIEIDFTEDIINLSTLQKWIDLAGKQYPAFFRNK